MNGKAWPRSLPGERGTGQKLAAVLGFTVLGVLLGRWWDLGLPLDDEGSIGDALLLLLFGGLLLALAVALAIRMLRSSMADAHLREPVSGLYRRAYADEVMRGQIAREDRMADARIAVVLVRIRELAGLRRRHGAEVADQLVRIAGRQIDGQTRGGDIPTRHEADLLAVYLDCDELEQAEAFGRRIRMLLASQQFEWRGEVIKVEVGLGIARRQPGETIDALLARAGTALASA